jgi:hypothetical protein
MREKIDKALLLLGFMVPKQVKEILQEMGSEIDRLRAEVNIMRSQYDDGK